MSESQQPGQGSLPQEERETQDETTLLPTTYTQKRIDRLSWDTPLSSVDVSSAEEMPRLPSFKADDENVWRDRRSYLNRFDRRHLTPSTERPSTTRRSSLSHEISPDEIDSPTVTDPPSRPVSPLSLPADQPCRPSTPEPPSPVSPSRPVNPLVMESFDWSDESDEVSPTEYKRGSVAEMYHTTEEESPSPEEKAAPSEDLTAPEVDDVSSGQDPFSNFDSVSPEAPQETIENVEGSPKLVAAPPMDYLATQ
ncbi:hypothetical protein B9Z65_3580 [Elsinoe australis]|uniref:Uncharacterized protein n=1 Tax=Elsinoe australis TaxID=40998 RepID=A0A2P8AFL8_9PEZI|nr:hypothetical protein B9Z65_3580 [Elsinoe australis]